MKKYRVYGIMAASKYFGEFEAESKEAAEEFVNDNCDFYASLCHHCAGEIELADICELQSEEVEL